MKKLLLVLMLMLSGFGFSQDFDGTWSIKIDYRYSKNFKHENKNLIKTIQYEINEGIIKRYDNKRNLIKMGKYEIIMLSNKEIESGIKIPLIEYKNNN